jgi:major membrane immunogen (membrane-anchored lipoprotein)
MANLYSISARLAQLLAQEDYTAVELDELAALNSTCENECINRGKYIKNLEAEAEAILKAIKEMRDRADGLLNEADRQRKKVFDAMKSAKHDKIFCEYFDLKIQKNPPSVEVLDGNVLDAKYFNVKEVQSIDKARIKEDLKAGIAVEGARLVLDSERLVIK